MLVSAYVPPVGTARLLTCDAGITIESHGSSARRPRMCPRESRRGDNRLPAIQPRHPHLRRRRTEGRWCQLLPAAAHRSAPSATSRKHRTGGSVSTDPGAPHRTLSVTCGWQGRLSCDRRGTPMRRSAPTTTSGRSSASGDRAVPCRSFPATLQACEPRRRRAGRMLAPPSISAPARSPSDLVAIALAPSLSRRLKRVQGRGQIGPRRRIPSTLVGHPRASPDAEINPS
jgi:hypothetical protein